MEILYETGNEAVLYSEPGTGLFLFLFLFLFLLLGLNQLPISVLIELILLAVNDRCSTLQVLALRIHIPDTLLGLLPLKLVSVSLGTVLVELVAV